MYRVTDWERKAREKAEKKYGKNKGTDFVKTPKKDIKDFGIAYEVKNGSTR